jgi:carbon storage regulator
MLILMLRPGEALLIGDAIVVEVRSIDRGQVSIGIKAPRHVRIDRAEVAERRKAEGQKTAKKQTGE